MEIVVSKTNIPIRLSEERWRHVINRHPEMVEERDKVLETIIAPDLILQGDKGATMAIRFYPKTKLTSKYLVVVYKEISPSDGFILTAFYANQYAKWRKVIWKK